MEEKQETQCITCIHKGICKNEERYRDAIKIWSKNETDENNEIIYEIKVYCPHQLKYSDIESFLLLLRTLTAAERDDW